MESERRSSQNDFIDDLEFDDFNLLRSFLSDVPLALGEQVAGVGKEIDCVWFPTTAVLSVVTAMGDGQDVETCTIGYESAYGLLNALGSPMSINRVITQIAGRAWKMPAARLRAAAAISVTMTDAIIRHSQVLIGQIQQTAACNALHNVEARLCRWLLMTADRTGSNQLPLTQEFLSYMLGVQRTTVTAAAQALQSAGYIRYSRGRIDVLARAGLMAMTCECYQSMIGVRDEVLGPRSAGEHHRTVTGR